MTRFVLPTALVVSSLLLTACGDTGDHFGEFKKTNARVVPVVRVTLAMPTFTGLSGVYPLQVTAYEAAGNPVPVGQSYTHPISISSGGSACTATFATSSKGTPSFQSVVSVPNTTTQVFAQMTCSPTTITATDPDMPRPVSITL